MVTGQGFALPAVNTEVTEERALFEPFGGRVRTDRAEKSSPTVSILRYAALWVLSIPTSICGIQSL